MKGMIKEAVLKLGGYSVAQDFSRVKLNQNESPVDIPTEVKEEILRRLKAVHWNRYPPSEADSLIQKIAHYAGCSTSRVMVGSGSNELIQAFIYAVCDSGDSILVVQPGFSIYKRVAKVMNINVVEVPLKEDFSFDVEAIIEREKKAKLVILASPHNPTGTALKFEEIKRIALNFNGMVAVDEAYYGFHRETAQGLIDELNNIVIFRTFSKALGLAGIRLGYLLGREETVRELLKSRLPFSPGIFQQVAGEVALEKIKVIEQNVDRIIEERERLFRRLKEIRHIQPIPSHANFLLFESKHWSGKELYERLYENGVVVRYFHVLRLKNMLRVTVGTPEENDIFLEKMEQITERNL
ncbi:MAG: histidinol-phosphate transaminase [Candidatus Aminicenantes bacterium]